MARDRSQRHLWADSENSTATALRIVETADINSSILFVDKILTEVFSTFWYYRLINILLVQIMNFKCKVPKVYSLGVGVGTRSTE